ncbi:MAG: hypothetical protein RIQ60_3760 [Pseudomonadota bacterium]|jgi:adenine-specific DNA-methyltransferase
MDDKLMDEKAATWRPTPVPLALLQAARHLRREMTDVEHLLWRCLRGRQLGGFKFRKQHPLQRVVLDFYCASARLAIELDGSQHGSDEGRARDAERTALLEAQGIRVLRFLNNEVLDDLEGVLTRIWQELHAQPAPRPQPLPSTPPPSGGR